MNRATVFSREIEVGAKSFRSGKLNMPRQVVPLWQLGIVRLPYVCSTWIGSVMAEVGEHREVIGLTKRGTDLRCWTGEVVAICRELSDLTVAWLLHSVGPSLESTMNH